MLTFLTGRVTSYYITLNLAGMIDIGSLKTVACPYDNKYHRFFLIKKKATEVQFWRKRLRLLVVPRFLLKFVELYHYLIASP